MCTLYAFLIANWGWGLSSLWWCFVASKTYKTHTHTHSCFSWTNKDIMQTAVIGCNNCAWPTMSIIINHSQGSAFLRRKHRCGPCSRGTGRIKQGIADTGPAHLSPFSAIHQEPYCPHQSPNSHVDQTEASSPRRGSRRKRGRWKMCFLRGNLASFLVQVGFHILQCPLRHTA